MKIALISQIDINQIFPSSKITSRPVTWTENLITGLKKNTQNEFHVITGISPRHKRPTKQILVNGVTYHFYYKSGRFAQLSLYLTEIYQVRKILNKIKPDIVHGQGLEGVSGFAAIFSGYPHLVTIHGIINEIFSNNGYKLAKFLEKLAIKKCKNFISLNPYVNDIIRKYDTNVKYKKICEIPNAVAEELFDFPLNKNKTKKNNILFCGVFRERKGLKDLLIVLKELKIENYSFNLIITGIKGPDEESTIFFREIQNIIHDNFKENTKILGFVDPLKMPEIYQNSDLLVLPSKAETAPMVISEAMAAGLAVIAYDVGGIKYMVSDKETGFVVKKNDLNDLKLKIKILLKDEKRLAKFKMKAREKAMNLYHPEIVASKTLEVYESIIKNT